MINYTPATPEQWLALMKTLIDKADKNLDGPPARRINAEVEALIAVTMFLRDMGMFDEFLQPLTSLAYRTLDLVHKELHGNGPGPKRRPVIERLRLASSAAAVTDLVARNHSVGAATSKVSRAVGIDAKRLRNLRDNIGKGHADGLIKFLYDDRVAEFARLSSEADLMRELAEVRAWKSG